MLKRLSPGLMLILLFACTVERKSDYRNKASAAQKDFGSCLQKDSTVDAMMCFERSNPSLLDRAACEAAQGTWSTEACDQALYERICKQETIETIDNGKPQTVIYTYYFKKDSSFICAGDEVSVDASIAPASDRVTEPSAMPQEKDGASGAALYTGKGCASCHGELEASTLRGYSAESIVRASNGAQHNNVIWPSVEESLAIRDALSLSSAEWIALGRSIYTASCQNCHQGIDQSTIINQTLSGMVQARGLNVHQNTSWPNERDLQAIAVALREP